MTSRTGLGVPIPQILPVTGTWTLPFATYLVYLSQRVVYRRVQKDKYMGDRYESNDAATSNENPDPLFLESRAHANFLENVPIALTLAAIAEINGANRKILNYALAALFALRVLHVELGIKGKNSLGFGRPLGFFGTQAFIAGVAAWSAYLAKGYWGY